jgi:hypothetical protein
VTHAKSVPTPNKTLSVSPDGQADPGDAPVITVVRGQPTDVEIAALVAVLASRAREGAAGPANPERPAGARRSGWSDKSQLMRQPITTGQGVWKRSALPR